MQVIRGTEQLAIFLKEHGSQPGVLADTGFLYAVSYTDDRLYNQAMEAFDLLAEYNVKIYANVISRMELVDLVFRKQITLGAIQTFKGMTASTSYGDLYKHLKNIRDEDTAQKSQNKSYKVSEGQLKKLRKLLEQAAGPDKWKEFCSQYVGQMLSNEWVILEQELGFHFIEVLEGGTSDIINQPLNWTDMVQVMGEQGIRGPDAMIANLFLKSRLPLLITTDSDIVDSFKEDDPAHKSKTIFHLDQ